MPKQNIVLLTATIRPKPDQPNLCLTNVEDRLSDYNKALSFYVGKLRDGVIDKIVFVDNSGYDLAEIENKYPDGVEFISFYDLDYPGENHRGYGEFRLVDHAFENSATLSQLMDSDHVWKITGRYIIKNLDKVIRFAPKRFDIYVNFSGRWIDMEIMSWSSRGYSKLIKNVWKQFEGRMPPELKLKNIIDNAGSTNVRVVDTFYYPAFIVGRRGTDGSSFVGRLGYFRHAAKVIMSVLLYPVYIWRGGLS